MNHITLNNAAGVIESHSYTACGDHRTHDDQAVRLSYLGRVHVNKPDLEVIACPKPLQGSIRLYDPEYCGFLIPNLLWEKDRTLQPYQYAGNSPVMAVDRTGLVVQAATPEAQDAVRSSVPSYFREFVVFDSDGTLLAGPLLKASEGQDPQSNIVRLAALAAHEETVEVMVVGDNDIVGLIRFDDQGREKGVDFFYEAYNSGRKPDNQAIGTTWPSRSFKSLSDMPKDMYFSEGSSSQILLREHPADERGSTAAHELVHIQLLFDHKLGLTPRWRHGGDEQFEARFIRAEEEAR